MLGVEEWEKADVLLKLGRALWWAANNCDEWCSFADVENFPSAFPEGGWVECMGGRALCLTSSELNGGFGGIVCVASI